MKTEYKYIRFVEKGRTPKTVVYSCQNRNSGEELGEVRWYFNWRQYCYFPTAVAVYSKGCLKDIIDFISTLEAERKRGMPI